MCGLSGDDRRARWALGAIVALALVVRVAAVVATPHLGLASDPADYDAHGRSIAAGRGYPPSSVAPAGGSTAIRPPGFPLFVALAYKLSGDEVAVARVGQALIGTLVVALIALIAWQLFGRREALIAGALAAIFPPLVIDGITLLSEPLFVAFELGAVLALLRWREGRATPPLVAAGVLAGAAILTRSTGVLLLLPLAVAAVTGSWRSARSYRAPALLLGCAFLVVAPWTVRNAVELRALVPVSTQGGYTLAGTYNAVSRSRAALWLPASVDPEYARLIQANRHLSESALGSRLGAAARRYATHHPSYLLTVAGHNALRLFNLGGASYERTVAARDYGLGPSWAKLMTWGLFPFLALALIGAATGTLRRGPPWLWAIPVLMLSTIMVLATNRFRAPIDPFIILLAAAGLARLVSRARPART